MCLLQQLSLKKALDAVGEKHSTCLPDAELIEAVVEDEAVSDLFGEDCGGATSAPTSATPVVLDEGKF